MVLFALFAIVAAQAPSVEERDQATVISDLAYSPAIFRDLLPMQAVQQNIIKLKQRAQEAAQATSVAETRRRIQLEQAFLNSLIPLAANRDAVAFRRDTSRGSEIHFGMRGTSGLRDVIPDARLLFNMKTNRRLDESRQFVHETLQANPFVTSTNQIHFAGHSLGGWVAEGVSRDYPGSYVITFQTAAPLFGDDVNAFPPVQPGARLPNRFVRGGDVVPLGVDNMGPGNNIEAPAVSGNPINNHRLRTWMVDTPEQSQRRSASARMLQGAVAGTRQALNATNNAAQAVVDAITPNEPQQQVQPQVRSRR